MFINYILNCKSDLTIDSLMATNHIVYILKIVKLLNMWLKTKNLGITGLELFRIKRFLALRPKKYKKILDK